MHGSIRPTAYKGSDKLYFSSSYGLSPALRNQERLYYAYFEVTNFRYCVCRYGLCLSHVLPGEVLQDSRGWCLQGQECRFSLDVACGWVAHHPHACHAALLQFWQWSSLTTATMLAACRRSSTDMLRPIRQYSISWVISYFHDGASAYQCIYS